MSKDNDDRLTWAQIIAAEPRVAALYLDARKIKDDKSKSSFCANAVWYDYFKDRVVALVGFSTNPKQPDPRLRSMDAYDLVYHKCYQALPNCRNCNCF